MRNPSPNFSQIYFKNNIDKSNDRYYNSLMEAMLEKNHPQIDITYDFRLDSNGGDPDAVSPTLAKYHKIFWSKVLPNGSFFDLTESKNQYNSFVLEHKSGLGEYWLSSDSIIASYSKYIRMQNIIKNIPEEEIKIFLDIAYTIGGFIVFPCNVVNNLPTINQDRGFSQHKIKDRFDLTLECIRRYYINKNSPMEETIKRYDNYFKLFDNFKGYCDYFFLQDLVSDDYSEIKFFLPFNDFKTDPFPSNVDEYIIYKNNNIVFLQNRNKRFKEYLSKNIS
jgi:hypothetical protein